MIRRFSSRDDLESLIGIDFASTAIATLTVKAAECADLCNYLPTCLAYTTDVSLLNNCVLKSTLGAITLNSTMTTTIDVLSFMIPVSKNYTAYVNTAFVGSTLVMYPFADSARCKTACDYTPGCLAFSVDNNKVCSLQGVLGLRILGSGLTTNVVGWTPNVVPRAYQDIVGTVDFLIFLKSKNHFYSHDPQ